MEFVKYILLLSLIGLLACKKIKSYSDHIVINYLSFTYSDTTLLFSFINENGELGLNTADTLPPLADSLFVTLYKKSNKQYIPLKIRLDYGFNIPEPIGQDKNLIGQIKVSMTLLNPSIVFQSDTFIPDTFMLKFYIQDRSLRNSNVDSTPDLYKIYIGKNIPTK